MINSEFGMIVFYIVLGIILIVSFAMYEHINSMALWFGFGFLILGLIFIPYSIKRALQKKSTVSK